MVFNVRWRPYKQDPKSYLLAEGVRIILSAFSVVYVRYPFWGGVQFLGDFDLVPGLSSVTDEYIHKRGWEMLRKADMKRADILGNAALIGGDYSVLYPTVWAYLTQATWEDGSVRKTSSITLFTDAGQLKAVLKDKETNLSLWSAGQSIEQVLGVMEALLLDPTAVWRQDRQETGSSNRVKPQKR